jgi:hypothetical protein
MERGARGLHSFTFWIDLCRLFRVRIALCSELGKLSLANSITLTFVGVVALMRIIETGKPS